MADVNSNISVNIDSSKALSQLKTLQRQIAQFHLSVSKSSEAAALAQRDLQRNLINSINSIGAFSAELRTVKTSAENFTTSLEKNKFSMREYFRYAGASTKTFGRLFKSEFDTIGRVAEERVKRLQTQYIKLGRDTTGAMKAIAVMPTELNLKDHSTQLQLAAQRQAIFNQLVKQGSTNLLNFGKNTQWAGRQLMVGFTIPITMLGTAAAKTFMDMETAAIKFKKVYGDLFTPAAETQKALENIQDLGSAFTRYGIAVSDTVSLAAEAAAAGFQGLDLQRQTTEATRLQVLGQIDAQKALETTISLQNAFQMSSEDLAESINFLNAVENQTVVSLDDITTAIPKAAPVVKQLGGDVKDLAFFMAAMKEGGINASEGANALKSGLASLINPTDKAREMMQGFGIDIDTIVNKNAGNVKQTVIEFAQALDNLSDLNRQRAIEQLFGKFQLARLSTLFENVTKTGNQASRVLDLATASTGDLAAMAEKELGMTAESSMNKFRKAVEDLKVALVPVGKIFLETVTPILESLGGILDKFASLSEGSKRAIAVLTIAIGGIAPVLLMTFGLLANFIANGIKFFALLRNGYLRLSGQSQILGAQTQYLTTEQLDAAAAAHSLNQSHANLTQTFSVETQALNQLIAAYQSAATAARNFAAANPGMMMPVPGKGRAPKKLADGIVSVPGPKGAGDVVPAMLSPGEAVIPAKMAEKYGSLINGMVSGNIPGFQQGKGVSSASGLVFAHGIAPQRLGKDIADALMRSASQSQRAAFGQATSLTGLTNFGFIAPEQLNKGKMTGTQASAFFAQNSELATSRILKSITDLVPSAANDPAVKKDVLLFGENLSRQLATAGSKAVSEADFYKHVEVALSNTMKQATTAAFRNSLPIIQSQMTTISAIGGPLNRGERGQRYALSRATQAAAFGYQTGMTSYKASTLTSQVNRFSYNMGNAATQSVARGAATASPSRKAKVVGEDIAKGLQIGMASQAGQTAAVANNLGNTATSALAKPTFRQRAAAAGRGLVGGRAGMAASTALMAGSFLPGKAGQVAGTAATAAFGLQAIAGLAKVLPIPHLKVFGLALAGTIGVIKLVNAARERERRSIEGLADAATLTTDKVGTLGEFFGVTPTKTEFESDISLAGATPAQRTAVQQLIASEGFQKEFGKDIETIRGATGGQSRAIFKSIAIGLQGKGFATEQIQTIIDALRQEGRKTDVRIDVKSLSLGTAKGQANLQKSAEGIVDSFTSAFSKGFEEKMVRGAAIGPGGRGGYSLISTLVPTKELQKQTKFAAAQISNLLLGIGGALQNGQISAEQFNNSFANIQKTINNLNDSDPSAALMLMQGVVKAMPENFRKAAAGIKSVEGNMLLLKMQALGLKSNLLGVADAFKILENPLSDVSDRIKAQLLIDKTTKQTVANAKKIQKALEEAFGGGKGGGSKKDKFSLTKMLTENIKSIKNQTSALKAMKKAGIDAKIAAELASNPKAAAAISKLADNGGKSWKEATRLLKDYQKAQKELEDEEFRLMSRTEKMGTALEKLGAYYDLQEQLINMNYADQLEKENKALDDQQFILDDVNNKIDAISKTIEEKTAPLTKILEDNNYELERLSFIEDEINDKYDKQEEALDKIASLQQNIAEIQRGRLSVAEALSRGDISAAASAIQELRATQSSQAVSSQRDILAVARKQELSALNRLDIEKQNKLIQFEIATIQRETSKKDLENLNQKKKVAEDAVAAIERNIGAIENEVRNKIAAMATTFQSMFGVTRTQISNIVSALDLSKTAGIEGNKQTLDLILGAASGNATALNTALSEAPTLFDPVLTKFGKLYDYIKSIFDYVEESTQPAKPEGVAGQEWVWENNKWVLKPLTKNQTPTPPQTSALTKTEESLFVDVPPTTSTKTSTTTSTTPTTTTTTSTTTTTTSTASTPKTSTTSKSTPTTKIGGGGGGGGGMMLMMAGGGMVKPRYFANGAFARGTDTIPAMLSPGEFVVRKSAVDNIGVNTLNRMNDGAYNGSGVYNYNLNVTLNGTDMDANDVANVVMSRIKQIDGQRIRRQVM